MKVRQRMNASHSISNSESCCISMVSGLISASNGPLVSPGLKFRFQFAIPKSRKLKIITRITCPTNNKFMSAKPLNLSSSSGHLTSALPLITSSVIFSHPLKPIASVYNDNPTCKTQVPFRTSTEESKNSARKVVGLIAKNIQQAAQIRVNTPKTSYRSPPSPTIPFPFIKNST